MHAQVSPGLEGLPRRAARLAVECRNCRDTVLVCDGDSGVDD